jgi:hypothetical protein
VFRATRQMVTPLGSWLLALGSWHYICFFCTSFPNPTCPG